MSPINNYWSFKENQWPLQYTVIKHTGYRHGRLEKVKLKTNLLASDLRRLCCTRNDVYNSTVWLPVNSLYYTVVHALLYVP